VGERRRRRWWRRVCGVASVNAPQPRVPLAIELRVGRHLRTLALHLFVRTAAVAGVQVYHPAPASILPPALLPAPYGAAAVAACVCGTQGDVFISGESARGRETVPSPLDKATAQWHRTASHSTRAV
jgi:hypothetical protein